MSLPIPWMDPRKPKHKLKPQSKCQLEKIDCEKELAEGVMDLFCRPCDKNGKYVDKVYSHPLDNSSWCINVDTEETIQRVPREREHELKCYDKDSPDSLYE